MTTETSQRRTIGAFLITGTLLALYLTIEVGYAIYWEQFTTLMLRGGVMSKIALIVIFTYFPLLFVAGLISTISFFRKGHIWEPVTKGIIVNIYLWLTLATVMICLLACGLIYKICGLSFIGLSAWLMLHIREMIK